MCGQSPIYQRPEIQELQLGFGPWSDTFPRRHGRLLMEWWSWLDFGDHSMF